MPSKPSSSEFGGACNAFMEALDGYISGLISLERLRLTTSLLLDGNFDEAKDMLAALDSTLKEGYLDHSSHRILCTLIELETSEDEPTASPRRPSDLLNLQSSPPNDEVPDVEDELENGELKPGMILRDRFTLLEQIDSGGTGKIFKAIDRLKEESGSDSPWVAIKSITEALSNPPNALVALQKEVANARRLSHPNIIRVFDFDRDGENVFMIMELLDGIPLTELLNLHRFRPYPAAEAKSIIEGICRGLTYAHDLGIVHADVKPGNVFVTSDKRTKLLDFGISVTVTDEPDDSEVYAHTPSYASCEVLEGDAPTQQDDVYSMACVAYRILAGRRAYDGATALSAEKKRLELKPVENITPREWAALRRATAFRRADRTPDILSFLNEFSAKSTASAAPVTSEADETPEAAPAFKARRKFFLIGTATAIAAVAVALWPEPPVTNVQPTNFGSETVAVVTESKAPGDVGPPIELRVSVDTKINEPAVPKSTSKSNPRITERTAARRIVKPNPIDELAKLVETSLDAGHLLGPPERSAKFYLTEIQTIDTNANELSQLRRRFADLMMLEVMVAIADEDFEAAEYLIAETKSVGVDGSMTARYEASLARARQAATMRETESLTAIFASATPAAVLSESDAEHFPVAELLRDPLWDAETMAAVSPAPGPAAETTGEIADITNDSAIAQLPETLPLSAFEFERHVQPKFPRRAADRRLSGWVDLRFLVNAQGKTENIEIMDSSPKGSFEKAARRAIAKWRFKPMMADGAPVEKLSIVRLRFDAQ